MVSLLDRETCQEPHVAVVVDDQDTQIPAFLGCRHRGPSDSPSLRQESDIRPAVRYGPFGRFIGPCRPWLAATCAVSWSTSSTTRSGLNVRPVAERPRGSEGWRETIGRDVVSLP